MQFVSALEHNYSGQNVRASVKASPKLPITGFGSRGEKQHSNRRPTMLIFFSEIVFFLFFSGEGSFIISRSLHQVDVKTSTHSQIDSGSRGMEQMILTIIIAFAVRQMLMHLKFGAHRGADCAMLGLSLYTNNSC